jgi:dynactin 1
LYGIGRQADQSSEIDDLRDQHQDVQKETAATSKEAQALLNLNMKLQTSASKAQNRTIDLELTKIEAGELKRHLDIALVSSCDPFREITTKS